jgi:hypothetical protein
MIREAELTYIKKRVHELYWNEDLNCARALLAAELIFRMSLFSDVDAPYPFLQLSSLKNGVFDTACKSKKVTKYDLVAIGQKADLSLSEFSSIVFIYSRPRRIFCRGSNSRGRPR